MGVVSMLALPTMLLRIPTVRGVVRRKTTVVRASVGRMQNDTAIMLRRFYAPYNLLLEQLVGRKLW